MLATLIANIASGETLLALRRAKVALVVYIFVALLALPIFTVSDGYWIR